MGLRRVSKVVTLVDTDVDITRGHDPEELGAHLLQNLWFVGVMEQGGACDVDRPGGAEAEHVNGGHST